MRTPDTDAKERIEWARTTIQAFAESHLQPRDPKAELEQLIQEMVQDLLMLAECEGFDGHLIAFAAFEDAKDEVDYLTLEESEDE
jgi:hypothetical protein